jgi:hypothetical protein
MLQRLHSSPCDYDADMKAEDVVKSKYGVAVLFLKCVEVDRRRTELMGAHAAVNCVSTLLSNV